MKKVIFKNGVQHNIESRSRMNYSFIAHRIKDPKVATDYFKIFSNITKPTANDCVSFFSILYGSNPNEDFKPLKDLMEKNNIRHNYESYHQLIQLYSSNHIEKAYRTYLDMVENGFKPKAQLLSELIWEHILKKDKKNAITLFKQYETFKYAPNDNYYNSAFSIYSLLNYDLLTLIRQFREAGSPPVYSTLNSLIMAIYRLPQLDHDKKLLLVMYFSRLMLVFNVPMHYNSSSIVISYLAKRNPNEAVDLCQVIDISYMKKKKTVELYIELCIEGLYESAKRLIVDLQKFNENLEVINRSIYDRLLNKGQYKEALEFSKTFKSTPNKSE